MPRCISLILLPMALGLVFCACSKKGDAVAMAPTSFDSAPVDLKNKWQAAAEFAAKNNYLGAATNLMDIFSQTQRLTPEQNDALSQAWQQLGNKAFAAANRGDKMATEAVLKMRDAQIGGRPGRR